MPKAKGAHLTGDNGVANKVKLALLAMQRYSWEQGTAMQAFLEQGDMEIVVLMAKEAVSRSLSDGRAANIGNPGSATDPCSVGEALIAACERTGDPVLKKGLDELLYWALHRAPRTETGVVYHVDNAPQIWSDSTFMLPPFLAAAGYPDAALLNLYGYWDMLFDEEAKLMSHMWDEGAKSFIRRDHWGGGNGWTLAAIARLHDMIPGGDRERLAGMGKTLIDGVLAHVRDDFLFHDVVDDGESFVETNLSQMLAYSLYRGILGRWLDKSYLGTAEKLYAAAAAKVDAFGLVRDCCGAPFFDRAGVSPEGQAFFLLMDAARSKLARGGSP